MSEVVIKMIDDEGQYSVVLIETEKETQEIVEKIREIDDRDMWLEDIFEIMRMEGIIHTWKWITEHYREMII